MPTQTQSLNVDIHEVFFNGDAMFHLEALPIQCFYSNHPIGLNSNSILSHFYISDSLSGVISTQ